MRFFARICALVLCMAMLFTLGACHKKGETDMTIGDLQEQKCLALYTQFKEWCEQNGYNKIMTNYTFKDDICALYDMEISMIKKDNKTVPIQVFYKRGKFNATYKPF